jgi:endonuclease YncB( thermonuclease family)
LEKEWRLWASLGALAILIIGYLYYISRPPMEGSEYLWRVDQFTGASQLTLKGQGKTIQFKMIGLEIPKSQAAAAAESLKQVLLNQWVKIKVIRENSDGVKEGFVFLSGEDMHARLIRQGLAKMDRTDEQYDVRPYIELELEAKRKKRGLWAQEATGAK